MPLCVNVPAVAWALRCQMRGAVWIARAGYPVVADRPNRPFTQIAAHAAPSAPAASFTEAITAVFANVKTL